MSEYRTIPLDSTPARRITTEFAEVQLVLRSYYNQTDDGWFVDILDTQGNAIALGVALVTGIELLYPYPDLDIGQLAYVTSNGSAGEGRADLGEIGQLVSKYD